MAKQEKKTAENPPSLAEVARLSGLTSTGVKWKRDRGWTDDEIIAGKQSARAEDLADSQRRKESALADLRELELLQKSGALIEVTSALKHWGSLVAMTRTQMTTMASACAERWAAITEPAEMRREILKEVNSRLTHLADDFRNAGAEALGSGSSDNPAAADPDGDGVGGIE